MLISKIGDWLLPLVIIHPCYSTVTNSLVKFSENEKSTWISFFVMPLIPILSSLCVSEKLEHIKGF